MKALCAGEVKTGVFPNDLHVIANKRVQHTADNHLNLSS